MMCNSFEDLEKAPVEAAVFREPAILNLVTGHWLGYRPGLREPN
jgi:hypothetical protein